MKKIQVAVCFLMSVAMMLLFIGSTVFAQPQCRIIRIYDEATTGAGEVIRIEPQTVVTEGSTCVIWVNLGKASMKVSFKEGQQCIDASSAASGFTLVDGCYVTNWVPSGGTSSITFTGKGTYEYDVEWEAAEARATGKLIVH